MNYKIDLVRKFLHHDKDIIIETGRSIEKKNFHHLYPSDDDDLLHSITIWYEDKPRGILSEKEIDEEIKHLKSMGYHPSPTAFGREKE